MACLSATTKAEERIDSDEAGAVDSSCMPTPTPSTGLRDASLTDSQHFRTVEKHSPKVHVSTEDEDGSAQALIVLKKAGIAQNISANCTHISTRTYTFGQPSSIPSLTRLPPRPSIEVHPAATCLSSAALTMRDDTRGIIVREEDYISTLTVSSATTISINLSAASSVTIQDAAATTTTSSSSDSANSALGPLLGGLLGGFFGLIAIVGGIWSLW
ncbi:uncharacterized protein LAESUDRAFT_230303 [Laetiporus sulphureus 93-53]|uniref:Uncharacterized protein n=1 Tax=Laetiporus sulphureus 93-53 TaxID=1314785 RepID=A0A165DQU2_9APHY|nr:uncharacterized protein LAESUDRAFT_230303 [Laetiporus sulphureus 93-53]KZT05429.1 hypothetical protein LAESUDRAFT_230303 [Laetiporus sulphureus 93-53]